MKKDCRHWTWENPKELGAKCMFFDEFFNTGLNCERCRAFKENEEIKKEVKMKSGKPVFFGALMIACFTLGGATIFWKAYSVLGILFSVGVIFLVLTIRGLAKINS